MSLSPENAAGTCMAVSGAVIDQAPCDAADPNQSFTFGDAATPSTPTTAAVSSAAPSSTTLDTAVLAAPTSPTTSAPAVVTSAATTASVAASVVSVSRAGGVLNPSAAAEANPRDDTATRAFSSVSIKSASGQCLFIDEAAGDFRENLIPITLQPCDGSAGQQFDFITSGKHNDQPNSALIVSSLTQGCLNFDSRRAAGDTVITFSCGGRADGGGLVTDSQLFAFTDGETSLKLQPNNGAGSVCFAPNANGKLDQATCGDDPNQTFIIA